MVTPPGAPSKRRSPAGARFGRVSPVSFLGRSAPPRVRPAALRNTYVVAREGRDGTVLRRKGADGSDVELARSRRRIRVGWPALASALLADALVEPASRRLAGDYAPFMYTPRNESRTITGEELRDWLETWRPALSSVFGSAR